MYIGQNIPHVNYDKAPGFFANALRMWEQCRLTPTGKLRSEQSDGFPLALAGKTGVRWVRKRRLDGVEWVIFRLYNTDVVKISEHDEIELDSFMTATTCDFVHAVAPHGICLHVNDGHWSFRNPAGLWVHVKDDRRLLLVPKGQGFVAPPERNHLRPFDDVSLDRSKASKALRESGLRALADWWEAAQHHVELAAIGRPRFTSDTNRTNEALALARQGKLREAASAAPWLVGGRAAPNFDQMRWEVYRTAGAITARKLFEIPDEEFTEIDRRARRMRKLGFGQAGW